MRELRWWSKRERKLCKFLFLHYSYIMEYWYLVYSLLNIYQKTYLYLFVLLLIDVIVEWKEQRMRYYVHILHSSNRSYRLIVLLIINMFMMLKNSSEGVTDENIINDLVETALKRVVRFDYLISIFIAFTSYMHVYIS